MTSFDENESFELSEYDPGWPQRFEEESALLDAALGDDVIDIKHVGSTSVPGLRAKPIIDILVAVELFDDVASYSERLAPLGYTHQQHIADDERLFFWKGTPRTHHLHIVEYATWEHQRHVIFRDYLRKHPDIARRYSQIKEELASAFKNDRPAYTRGKTAFIKAIMDRAVEEIIDPTIKQLVAEAEKQALAENADDSSDDNSLIS